MAENPDPVDTLEASAIDEALKATTADTRLQWINVANAAQARRKSHLEMANADDDRKHRRLRFIATTLTPILTTLVAIAVFLFQGYQFGKTFSMQIAQNNDLARRQNELIKRQELQNEDSKWQEAMKSVNLTDGRSALAGCLAMQAFFKSQRYHYASRMIAATLLPAVDNVSGFDEIASELTEPFTPTTHDHEMTQEWLVLVSQMVLMWARQQHKLDHGSALPKGSKVPPFLQGELFSIDPNPIFSSENQAMRDEITAWKLDTLSDNLSALLTQKPTKDLAVTPLKEMKNIVLLNATFDKIDFTNVNLSNSILIDSTFVGANFSHADLTNTTLRDLNLTNADLSGIENSSGSTWDGTNWRDAGCMSKKLFEKLEKEYPDRSGSKKIPETCQSAAKVEKNRRG